ncbi:acyl carrier protein [Actinoplanes sp. NPDC051475]|uniref:acyl carrier protein n=1 Tax=Actinoplanes sp. NPDC051475 TaxID=3157225 RepID=UPI00344B97BF
MTISHPELEAWLADQIASYLEIPPADVEHETDFSHYGLESVAAFILCGDIERHFGITVEATAAWDHPTVRALGAHLRTKLADLESTVP